MFIAAKLLQPSLKLGELVFIPLFQNIFGLQFTIMSNQLGCLLLATTYKQVQNRVVKPEPTRVEPFVLPQSEGRLLHFPGEPKS